MKEPMIINTVVLLAVFGLLVYAVHLIREMIEKQKGGKTFITLDTPRYNAPPPPENNEILKRRIEELEHSNAYLKEGMRLKDREINDLKNPPKPAKFKVGDRAGKYAIWQVNTDYPETAYRCVDASGQFSCFRESQIEAMMKLSEVKSPEPPEFPPDRIESNVNPSKQMKESKA